MHQKPQPADWLLDILPGGQLYREQEKRAREAVRSAIAPGVNAQRRSRAESIASALPVSPLTVYWALWRTRDNEEVAILAVKAAHAAHCSVSAMLAHLPYPDEPYVWVE